MKLNARSLAATAVLSSLALVGMASNAKAEDLWMLSGDSQVLEVYLGADQIVTGVCDSDCYDLDLHLFDVDGNLVSQDVATDAAPIVAAPWEGTFYLQVDMVNCAHPSGCGVSVN